MASAGLPAPTVILIDAARDGDQAAWTELHDGLAPDLLRFATRRGAPEPEDLVQDVLAAAARGIDRFDGTPQQFRSWVFTIAHRRVADAHRRRYAEPEVVDDEAAADAPDPGHRTAEDLVEDRESVGEALAALAVLKPREREVLLLRIVEDRSAAEIAHLLGLRTVNVRVIQSRALSKVRARLQAQEREFSRKFRNGLLGLPIALYEMAFTDRAHALTDSLPRDPVMGPWIDSVRAEAAGHLGSRATAAEVIELLDAASVPASVAAGTAAAGTGGAVSTMAGATASATTIGASMTPLTIIASIAASAAVTVGAAGVAFTQDSGSADRDEGRVGIEADAHLGATVDVGNEVDHLTERLSDEADRVTRQAEDTLRSEVGAALDAVAEIDARGLADTTVDTNARGQASAEATEALDVVVEVPEVDVPSPPRPDVHADVDASASADVDLAADLG